MASCWKSSTPRPIIQTFSVPGKTTNSPTICKFNEASQSTEMKSTNEVKLRIFKPFHGVENHSASKINTIKDNKNKPQANGIVKTEENVAVKIPVVQSKDENNDSSPNITVDNEVEIILDYNQSESDNVSVTEGLHSNTESVSSTVAKVVVQALPAIQLGTVSALNQFINPVIKKSSPPSSEFINDNFDSVINRNSECSDFSQIKSSPLKPIVDTKVDCGAGVKLITLDHVVAGVSNASPHLLSALHRILYGNYAIAQGDEMTDLVSKILNFSGYPFPPFSEIYKKKVICLKRMPQKMLENIYRLLFCGSAFSIDHNNIVKKLLQFLMKPGIPFTEETDMEADDEKQFTTYEYEWLKEEAMKGPKPIVLLTKLNSIEDCDMNQNALHEDNSCVPDSPPSFECDSSPPFEYDSPTDDSQPQTSQPTSATNGLGNKLKSDERVVSQIKRARRRIINLLHTLLYGRPGSDEANRLNILEFNGFPVDNEEFLNGRISLLKRMKKLELQQLCDIFSIRAKSKNKSGKIYRLFHYLQAPFSRLDRRRRLNKSFIRKYGGDDASERKRDKKTLGRPRLKLKDFENIRSKIECAPAQELTELNDLLFLKPCNNLEIHQKILEFSYLPNDENCSAVQCRKTLLQYMNFNTLMKIAQFLDIQRLEEYKYPEDLSQAIIKFLMEMKLPSRRKRSKVRSNIYEKTFTPRHPARHNIMKLQNCDNIYENYCDSGSSEAMQNPTTPSEVNAPEVNTEGDSNTKYVVHQITQSSCSWTDPVTKEYFTVTDENSDEAILLKNFAKHPSNVDLLTTIRNLIPSMTDSTTLGDFINKVVHQYPDANLCYRIDFIKSLILQVLHEMQLT